MTRELVVAREERETQEGRREWNEGRRRAHGEGRAYKFPAYFLASSSSSRPRPANDEPKPNPCRAQVPSELPPHALVEGGHCHKDKKVWLGTIGVGMGSV